MRCTPPASNCLRVRQNITQHARALPKPQFHITLLARCQPPYAYCINHSWETQEVQTSPVTDLIGDKRATSYPILSLPSHRINIDTPATSVTDDVEIESGK